jgi:inner membrane protein
VSPIVHAELSWLVAQGLPDRRDRILVTVAGVAPDLDGLTILGGIDTYAEGSPVTEGVW